MFYIHLQIDVIVVLGDSGLAVEVEIWRTAERTRDHQKRNGRQQRQQEQQRSSAAAQGPPLARPACGRTLHSVHELGAAVGLGHELRRVGRPAHCEQAKEIKRCDRCCAEAMVERLWHFQGFE